ncbi:MAG TPA: protein kinase [Kofleriaceae bacterium]|nr:protein kinase [Kofleriaceae bacterium]
MTSACLDDNDAAEFASGALSGAAATRVETHLASCRDCRALVAALAPQDGEADSDVVTAPRPARLPRGKRRRDVGLEATIPRSANEPEIMVGDTIGRYVILARLGAGGMGVVWSAYDPQLDRKVAIKLLRAGSGVESSEGRARLVREAQAIAQLSHPNVVAVYDVGTAESGEVYIAMEFVEGETLTTWLARWERTWREVLDVFLQAGRGLAAAHAVGLLHRDFKPDNVLVGSDGRVRVTDFGLARSFITHEEKRGPAPSLAALRVTLTATGTVLGTPRYMAPEQVRGHDTDARSDQFSFCVAMFESLYGKHPLQGDTAAAMVESGERAEPAPDGPVPASIGKSLARGLELVPVKRWPSMQTLLHELTPPPVRTRERWLVAGLGGLVLAGAAAATVMATGSSAATPTMPPDEKRELEDRIAKLEAERTMLLAEIEKFQHDAQKLAQLRQQIVERDEKIIELTNKLADVPDAGVPKVIARTPPPPPPAPPARGLTLGVIRDVGETLDLARCFSVLPGTQELAVRATIMVTPDGKSHFLGMTGVEDGAPSVCVKGRFTNLEFPAGEARTTITFTVKGDVANFTVTPTIDAVSDGADQIDTGDLQRP